MRKNIGPKDKAIRISLAIVIAVLYFTNIISGPLAIVFGGLAVLLLLTSFISFCPLYLPFSVNTKTNK